MKRLVMKKVHTVLKSRVKKVYLLVIYPACLQALKQPNKNNIFLIWLTLVIMDPDTLVKFIVMSGWRNKDLV